MMNKIIYIKHLVQSLAKSKFSVISGYICLCDYMCTCMCMYMYIYIYTHTHTHTHTYYGLIYTHIYYGSHT